MIPTDRLILAICELNQAEREAFLDRALLYRKLDDIAVDLGCTRSNVGLLEKKARKKLRAFLAEDWKLEEAA